MMSTLRFSSSPTDRRSPLRARRRLSVAAAAATLALLAGCAAADDGPDIPLDAALGDETCSFTFATTPSVDPGQVPTLAALDAMRELGCDIAVETLEGSELLTEGVVQNRYQIAGIGSSPYFTLVQRDQPIVMLLERSGNDWVILGETGVSDCEDIADVGSFGISSLAGVAAALGGYWFNQECSDLEPPFIAVPGGPERAQALLAGQIASSVLPLTDALKLLEEAPDQLEMVANLGESIPGVITYSTISTNGWVEQNPLTVKLFMRLVLEEHRKIIGDPDYLAELMEKYDVVVEDGLLAAVAEAYATDTIFDPNGGATLDKMELTIEVFTSGGALDADPEIDVNGPIVARDLLDEVLDEIGRE